ncbi:hypothetical protein CGCS363_v004108 [Colletotrichum siamense]|uniref:uncharacterized protein n=1 Tax=Colletotrichum siamense TaxID=690259 RepID=UPI0018733D4C|nr:uncharacterized protein CGCS363_v004108 [Colletotrichum siamense]KAF5506015.1 hypothetical protein CGCS363_v004108 [Colletotrichum siamense]
MFDLFENISAMTPGSYTGSFLSTQDNASETQAASAGYSIGRTPSGVFQDSVNNAFIHDLELLKSPTAPLSDKKPILDVLCDKVFPFRLHDGDRRFPPMEFYSYLLYNSPNRDFEWPLAFRCVTYFHQSSAATVDNVIQDLVSSRAVIVASGVLTESFGQTKPPQKQKRIRSGSAMINHAVVNNDEPQELLAPPAKWARAISIVTGVPVDYKQLIATELDKPCSFTYRKLITSIDHSTDVEKAYYHHIRKDAPNIANDHTWPDTQDKMFTYIQQAVEAILDTSNFHEKDIALEKARAWEAYEVTQRAAEDEMNTLSAQATLKRKRQIDVPKKPSPMTKLEMTYADPRSSPSKLLHAAVHHELRDIEVERSAMSVQTGKTMKPYWASSGTPKWERYPSFASRWDAVCHNLRHHKVTVHSLLRQSWGDRLTASPAGERKLKLGNKAINAKRDVQNRAGRETLRREEQAF